MPTTADFWNERVKLHGHTGWGNVITYSFDQTARLAAVQRILDSLAIDKTAALDFGCGSGDFAHLLATYFKRVLAFDISGEVIQKAKKQYGRASNIEFIQEDSVTDLAIEDDSLDMILSITVLQHILDDEELSRTLGFFRRKLRSTGLLIAQESVWGFPKDSGGYMRHMSFDEWVQVFSRNGFGLRDQYGFYHPIIVPCKSLQAYRRTWIVSLMRLYRKYFGEPKWMEGWCRSQARSVLAGSSDFYWPGKADDPMKIMVFNPAGRA